VCVGGVGVRRCLGRRQPEEAAEGGAREPALVQGDASQRVLIRPTDGVPHLAHATGGDEGAGSNGGAEDVRDEIRITHHRIDGDSPSPRALGGWHVSAHCDTMSRMASMRVDVHRGGEWLAHIASVSARS